MITKRHKKSVNLLRKALTNASIKMPIEVRRRLLVITDIMEVIKYIRLYIRSTTNQVVQTLETRLSALPELDLSQIECMTTIPDLSAEDLLSFISEDLIPRLKASALALRQSRFESLANTVIALIEDFQQPMQSMQSTAIATAGEAMDADPDRDRDPNQLRTGTSATGAELESSASSSAPIEAGAHPSPVNSLPSEESVVVIEESDNSDEGLG